MSEILVPVSYGELLDKISILEIKSARIGDEAKLVNIRRELEALRDTSRRVPAVASAERLFAALKAVNERLWAIEDRIRTKERRREFDVEFIELARSVYFENDERSRIKREINLTLGSALVEEKSYEDYRGGTAPGAAAT